MMTAQEMEMMVKASRVNFGSDSKEFNPVKAELSQEALHKQLERKKRRAETFQNTKQAVVDWFRSFQTRPMFSAQ